MKLLLDTHIWIWMLEEPGRLARRIQQELQNEENELWLSPISTWEVLLLHAKRRIQLQIEAVDWIARATREFREAPLTHEIVVVSQHLRLPQADPADCFLAATAKVLDLTLLTADRHLLGLGEIATLANR
ncbi:MAG TPA: type II toxin-antitoxin system VapC family toxin [Candidatus Angelobacter sp.]|nr:type II toxin-antitoxin system VapC family toxin [Candidatus Angelobacter sp.]